jgi:hypothetical protein
MNGGGEEKNTYSVRPVRQSYPPSLDEEEEAQPASEKLRF